MAIKRKMNDYKPFFFIRMNRHLVSLFIKKLFKSLFYFAFFSLTG